MIPRKDLLAGAVALTFITGGAAFAAGPVGVPNQGGQQAQQQGMNLQGTSVSVPSKSGANTGLSNETTGAGTNAKVNTQAPNQAPFDYSRINLTDQQQHMLFQAASNLPKQQLKQNVPGSPVVAGAKLPSGVKLSAIPSKVKQTIGANTLKDYKFAKLQNGDVVVVDPTNNTVQAVITPKEAQNKGAEATGQGVSPDVASPGTSAGMNTNVNTPGTTPNGTVEPQLKKGPNGATPNETQANTPNK